MRAERLKDQCIQWSLTAALLPQDEPSDCAAGAVGAATPAAPAVASAPGPEAGPAHEPPPPSPGAAGPGVREHRARPQILVSMLTRPGASSTWGPPQASTRPFSWLPGSSGLRPGGAPHLRQGGHCDRAALRLPLCPGGRGGPSSSASCPGCCGPSRRAPQPPRGRPMAWANPPFRHSGPSPSPPTP